MQICDPESRSASPSPICVSAYICIYIHTYILIDTCSTTVYRYALDSQLPHPNALARPLWHTLRSVKTNEERHGIGMHSIWLWNHFVGGESPWLRLRHDGHASRHCLYIFILHCILHFMQNQGVQILHWGPRGVQSQAWGHDPQRSSLLV